MTIIFGYDKIIDGNLMLNGYKFKNNKAPVNVGFLGDNVPKDLNEKQIAKLDNFIYNPFHLDCLQNKMDIKAEQVDQITGKYFYVIDVHDQNFFSDDNFEESKKLNLSDIVVKDIKNGVAKILVLFPNESATFVENIYDLFLSWSIKYNISMDSIILVSGNYCLKSFDNINYIPFSLWENAFRNMVNNYKEDPTEEFINSIINRKKRPKIFLNYNRRTHYHRIKLVYSLIQENLFNYGLVSLGKNPDEINNIINEIFSKDFLDSLPITFDDTNLNINQADSFIKEDYLNTYVSIVTETNIKQYDIFPTEKIFKPIVALHPFIVLTAPGFLKQLREFGYLTFSKWIDESYDLEIDLNTRINLIIQEIKKLTLKTEDELQTMLVEMLPTLQHNLDVFKKCPLIKKFQIQLEKELWK